MVSLSHLIAVAPLIALLSLIVALVIRRSKSQAPTSVAPPPTYAPLTGEEPASMTELDPAQRKFCHGCAAPLHVSAQTCPHCGAPQQFAGQPGMAGGRQPFPHGWHIVVTVLTMGLWLIPYILIWGFRDKAKYL